MDIVATKALESGYASDYWITPDATNGKGRPYPYMIYANLMKLDMGMPWQVIKIGDTDSDILEGRNAGVWTVGVLKGSSMLGMNEEEVLAMPEEELRVVLKEVEQVYSGSGAHYVIKDMSELSSIIEQINERLSNNEKPHCV